MKHLGETLPPSTRQHASPRPTGETRSTETRRPRFDEDDVPSERREDDVLALTCEAAGGPDRVVSCFFCVFWLAGWQGHAQELGGPPSESGGIAVFRRGPKSGGMCVLHTKVCSRETVTARKEAMQPTQHNPERTQQVWEETCLQAPSQKTHGGPTELHSRSMILAFPSPSGSSHRAAHWPFVRGPSTRQLRCVQPDMDADTEGAVL